MTDERIKEIRKGQQGRYGSTGAAPYADSIQFARAIEAEVRKEQADRIAELESALQSQKDQWLSWEEKRVALEKDAALYQELIYQVARKYRGETRHETAKRHIVAAESNCPESNAQMEAK
jgi:hypothetical protein